MLLNGCVLLEHLARGSISAWLRGLEIVLDVIAFLISLAVM
jgi:hypothetical protein